MENAAKERISSTALRLMELRRPNGDMFEELYEKALHIGKKVFEVVSNETENHPKSLEIIIAEIGNIDLNPDELDREYLNIAFHLTSLQNLLYAFVNSSLLDRESRTFELGDRKHELDELAAEVRKLNRYIEEQQREAKAETLALRAIGMSPVTKAAGMAQINLFFFSIPMQSVFDLIKAAKVELDKSQLPNIRYVGSLLTNASSIVKDFIDDAKSKFGELSARVKTFSNRVSRETTLAASKAVNLVYSSRLKKIKIRKTDFVAESESHKISSLRENLIDFLIDFRNWSPQNNQDIFASALFNHMMTSKQYFPYSDQVIHEISRDLVHLQGEPTEMVQRYVGAKAESLIETLSAELTNLETQGRLQI